MCDFFETLISYVWDFSSRHPAIALVFLGVLGEGFEIISKDCFKHWYEKHERILDRIGSIFWIIVVVGLAFEIPEAVRIDKETSDNEVLVANIGTTNAQLVASNLQVSLQLAAVNSNNLALSIELEKVKNPRTTSTEQITNFIFLTAHFPKNEIKVLFPVGRNETANYARQIRDMLNQADFKQETNAPMFGINPVGAEFSLIRSALGDTNWPSIVICGYSTNQVTTAKVISETANGFQRPTIVHPDMTNMVGNFLFVFKELGINAEAHYTTTENGIKTNEIQFFINDKP